MPLRPSTGTGRRARTPAWTACCSTMQYAYHAIGVLLLIGKTLGPAIVFETVKFTVMSFAMSKFSSQCWRVFQRRNHLKLRPLETQQKLCTGTRILNNVK